MEKIQFYNTTNYLSTFLHDTICLEIIFKSEHKYEQFGHLYFAGFNMSNLCV